MKATIKKTTWASELSAVIEKTQWDTVEKKFPDWVISPETTTGYNKPRGGPRMPWVSRNIGTTLKKRSLQVFAGKNVWKTSQPWGHHILGVLKHQQKRTPRNSKTHPDSE